MPEQELAVYWRSAGGGVTHYTAVLRHLLWLDNDTPQMTIAGHTVMGQWAYQLPGWPADAWLNDFVAPGERPPNALFQIRPGADTIQWGAAYDRLPTNTTTTAQARGWPPY